MLGVNITCLLVGLGNGFLFQNVHVFVCSLFGCPTGIYSTHASIESYRRYPCSLVRWQARVSL